MQVTDAEEASVFDEVFGVLAVDGVLRIQQGLCVRSAFSVPAVETLFHIVELCPIIVVPRTIDLVAALSHHFHAEFPVLV